MRELELLVLDIEEILLDLKSYWLDNEEYKYNPNAFENIKVQEDNIMCCCPFHMERRPSFGILKMYPYTSHCFQCDQGWSLPQLVQHVCGFPTIVHAERFLLKNYANTSKRPTIDIESLFSKGSDKKVPHLEQELLKYRDKRHPYLYSRGFSERTLTKYEIGYDEYSRTMVIPVRTSRGQIRFFKRRSVESKQFLNEAGVYKKDILYGLYYLLQAKESVPEIFITESETDTISLYQGKMPSVALMGRIMFKEQVKELLRAGVKKVNLFFDNDLSGLQCAYTTYKMLNQYPIRIGLVEYPSIKFGKDTWDKDEVDHKDANDLLLAGKLNEIEIVPFELSNYEWSKIMERSSSYEKDKTKLR